MNNNETTMRTPSYGLMRAAEAVTNWRALALTCIAGLTCFLFLALTGWLMRSSVALGGLLVIVSMAVWLIGYSSVGILLMRKAQGKEVSMMDAVMQATFSVHRLLGVAVLLFLIFLGVALAALLILFICKVPALGPLLYAFAFPVLTVVLGMTFAGLFYVGFPLAAPAIWEGNTAVQTVARLIGIVRKRLLSVITNLVMLMILVGFLSALVCFLLLAGYGAATGLSASVGISPMGGMASMASGMFGLGGGFGGGLGGGFGGSTDTSYMAAFAFASGLLLTIGLIIPFLTFINGTCLVYLQAVEGLNFGETEQKLRAGVDEAKRRAQESRDRAQAKLNEARNAARPVPQPAVQAPLPMQASSPTQALSPMQAQRTCVACNAMLATDDMFCGECGTKNAI